MNILHNDKKYHISKIRKIYIVRLIGRCFILGLCILICLFQPEKLQVMTSGANFFESFSPLHLLWGIWVLDMICQIVPIKKDISLGSQKLFANRFLPIRKRINYQALKNYIVATTRSAYHVFFLWAALGIILWILQRNGSVSETVLFMITVLFYVCDLICVLIWCPFRLIMKNRCCTTCRIFNWDHLMMFTPLASVNSFFARSLFFLSLAVWLVWEVCIFLYPERFWEHSNAALKCSNCTDKLCTQYCRKLRR